jgi:hypothetical protein
MLGGEARQKARDEFPENDPSGEAGHRWESVPAWQRMIARLKALVSLWDLVRVGDEGGLTALLVVTEEAITQGLGGIVRVRFSPTALSPDLEDSSGEVLLNVDEQWLRDLVLLAQDFLIEHVNRLLRDEVFWGLAHTFHESEIYLRPDPASLYGSMLFQFALAIAGKKDYRTCAVCGRWFELVPPATRVTRQTCSNACRQRQYRERLEQARKLHAKGQNAKQIAKELETDVNTVKRWITNRRG